ncbi:hypothetical protein CWI38_0375p0050 [Hamiltosporidium tvaerminnensis]|uniref:Uncharacterized protein n=1 Tax=Hamiltosporidium tvaerminnensis TaxID=1176355 RepID=A0A4Q9LZB6_9MICR|nr:hypothetical protein CWI38_0375p0050 [Hamiltosporidium tvaerminnensis]
MKSFNNAAVPKRNRLIVLHSILDSHRSVILAVKKRFKKTLRNGWSAFLKYYNRKFRRTVNNFVLKKSTQNEAENEIKQEEFGDRRRISTYCTEQFSLTVTTLCINPIEKFICEMKKISETEIRDVGVLTRKFLMNWCKTFTDASRIIQAAQAYHDMLPHAETTMIYGTPQADSFIYRLAYLIIYGISRRGSDYSSITCMFNLYMLITGWVAKIIQLEIIGENSWECKRSESVDLGTISLYKEYENNLKATYIDSDSRSLLLFALYMDSLCRNINEKYTKVTIHDHADSHTTNPLLFIDALNKIIFNRYLIRNSQREVRHKIAYWKDTATLLDFKDFVPLDQTQKMYFLQIIKIQYHVSNDAMRAAMGKDMIQLSFTCVELRSKQMLLQLLDCLERKILKMKNTNKTHLELIKSSGKCSIEKRKLHSKLYNARINELVSVSGSSRWLKKEIIKQIDDMCQYLNKSADDVDHLATRYEKILYHDYTSVIMKSKTVEEILENEACGDESAYQRLESGLNAEGSEERAAMGSVNINEESDKEKTVGHNQLSKSRTITKTDYRVTKYISSKIQQIVKDLFFRRASHVSWPGIPRVKSSFSFNLLMSII